MRIAVARESRQGETRVALVPDLVPKLRDLGYDVAVEPGAGLAAGFTDEAYVSAGAEVADDAVAGADAVISVQPLDPALVGTLAPGSVTISFLPVHEEQDLVGALRDAEVTAFAMELVPRISRAQAMDALSSQALVAGYRCAVVAAGMLGRFFPQNMTAAGTVQPADVVVLGAGVAGLQAIATAKRLGAVVSAYDVRTAAAEEIRSVGAKAIELDLETLDGAGGYAREMTEERAARQRELLAPHIAKADALITTAAVPGRRAPLLVTREMVEQMKPGSVVVDLAAESGGNVEGAVPGAVVEIGSARVWGGANVPAQMPGPASTLYAQNVINLLTLLTRRAEGDGEPGPATLTPDFDDEIVAGACVTHAGRIVHTPTREAIEGPDPEPEAGPADESAATLAGAAHVAAVDGPEQAGAEPSEPSEPPEPSEASEPPEPSEASEPPEPSGLDDDVAADAAGESQVESTVALPLSSEPVTPATDADPMSEPAAGDVGAMSPDDAIVADEVDATAIIPLAEPGSPAPAAEPDAAADPTIDPAIDPASEPDSASRHEPEAASASEPATLAGSAGEALDDSPGADTATGGSASATTADRASRVLPPSTSSPASRGARRRRRRGLFRGWAKSGADDTPAAETDAPAAADAMAGDGAGDPSSRPAAGPAAGPASSWTSEPGGDVAAESQAAPEPTPESTPEHDAGAADAAGVAAQPYDQPSERDLETMPLEFNEEPLEYLDEAAPEPLLAELELQQADDLGGVRSAPVEAETDASTDVSEPLPEAGEDAGPGELPGSVASTEAGPEAQPEAEPVPEPASELHAEPDAEPDVEPDVEPEPAPGYEPEPESGPEPEPEAEAELDADVEPHGAAEAAAAIEPEPASEPEVGPGGESEPRTNPAAEPTADAGPAEAAESPEPAEAEATETTPAAEAPEAPQAPEATEAPESAEPASAPVEEDDALFDFADHAAGEPAVPGTKRTDSEEDR